MSLTLADSALTARLSLFTHMLPSPPLPSLAFRITPHSLATHPDQGTVQKGPERYIGGGFEVLVAGRETTVPVRSRPGLRGRKTYQALQ